MIVRDDEYLDMRVLPALHQRYDNSDLHAPEPVKVYYNTSSNTLKAKVLDNDIIVAMGRSIY